MQLSSKLSYSLAKEEATDLKLLSYFGVKDEVSVTCEIIRDAAERLRKQVLQLAAEGHTIIVKTM